MKAIEDKIDDAVDYSRSAKESSDRAVERLGHLVTEEGYERGDIREILKLLGATSQSVSETSLHLKEARREIETVRADLTPMQGVRVETGSHTIMAVGKEKIQAAIGEWVVEVVTNKIFLGVVAGLALGAHVVRLWLGK